MVICPECSEQKILSIVRSTGMTSTLMGYNLGYYDPNGSWHPGGPNPNIFTTYYACSNGHKFTIRKQFGKILPS
jgi:hypothetical protein